MKGGRSISQVANPTWGIAAIHDNFLPPDQAIARAAGEQKPWT